MGIHCLACACAVSLSMTLYTVVDMDSLRTRLGTRSKTRTRQFQDWSQILKIQNRESDTPIKVRQIELLCSKNLYYFKSNGGSISTTRNNLCRACEKLEKLVLR